MDVENCVYMHNRALFICDVQQNYMIDVETDGTRNHHDEWNNPELDRQMLQF